MIEIVTKQPETGRGSSYELYDRIALGLFDVLKPGVRNVKQVSNLLWLVAAIVGGESIALSQIANLLPANAIAQSRVTRIREWLKNSRVDVWGLYRRVLERVLEGWNGADMALIMDGTMVFHERLHIVRISMAYGNRAFPLAWQVFNGTGLVSIDPLRPMITRLADFLKPYAGRVTLYADRGFRDHNWAKFCVALGWGYRIRIARSTHIRLRTGAIVQLDALKPRRFRTLCLCHAKLTDHGFGTHVTMTWSRGEGNQIPELVIAMSDRPAHPDRRQPGADGPGPSGSTERIQRSDGHRAEFQGRQDRRFQHRQDAPRSPRTARASSAGSRHCHLVVPRNRSIRFTGWRATPTGH